MQIQIDIEGMLKDALAQALAPETLKPILDKALNETLSGAIKDAFGYRSDFRKLMEESVAAAMPKNIDGLVIMGELVVNRIKDLVGAQQDAVLSQMLDEQLAELMEQPPQQMKLSELCRTLTKRWGDRQYDQPEGSRPTFIKETSSYGSVSLYMDKNEALDKHECTFDLHLSSEGGAMLSLKIRGEDHRSTHKHISRRWNDELYLTRLFAAGTKFEMDMGDGEYHDHYYHED